MIRLHTIGAAVFALATLALPTYALQAKQPERLTHLDTRGQLQDVNLAEVVATAQAAADNSDGLPTSWCGEDRTTDNTANAATPANKAQFKVVYAFAADQPNRFAGWRDAIQANVAIVQRFLSAQDGGTKAIRFDMGTSCGPLYTDIQIVPLPGTRAQYADNFSAIANAVQRALGASSTPRNAIVIADGLAGGTQEYGLGETIMGASGEKQGATNVHNRGGLTSVLFSKNGAPAPGNARWGWWPEGFLHEMTHNLGAVQWGAPHSTQPRGGSAPNYGHCWQGADVMCYVEDAGAAHGMQIDCAGLPGAIPQNFDCGRDDYFNPAPQPGTYLATHWNTYESAFLAPCGEIAPACGGGALWVPQAPAATAPPTVNGGSRRGSTLTAGNGAWTNGPTSYGYQWQRLARAGWENIDSETGATYTVTSDDLGRRLRVTVVATNPDGSAAAASDPTVPVGASGINRPSSKTSKKGKKGKIKAGTSSKKKKKKSAKGKKSSSKKKAMKKSKAKKSSKKGSKKAAKR